MGGSIASLFVEIGADVSGAKSGFQKVESGLTGLAGKATSFAAMAAGGFGMAVAQPILSGIGGSFGAITEGVIGTNAALESSAVSWGVLLGGADEAQAKIGELFAFGANTPFEFSEVDKAARLLQTFGGNALNTTSTLTMVGDAAAAANQPFEQVAFWTGRMYDAIQNGQPFGEAAAELQAMGLISGDTRRQLEQLQAEGKTGPEIWNAYTASQARFGGMMEEQSQTFNGRISTMKDSINMLLATAGKPIFDLMSNGLSRFTTLLASPAVATFTNQIANGMAGGLSQAAAAVQGFLPKLQAIGTTALDVFRALQQGDYAAAFAPIGAALDQAFGAGTGAKVTAFVQTLIAGFQTIGPVLLTIWQNFFPLGALIQEVTGHSTVLGNALRMNGPIIVTAFQTALPIIQALVPQLQAFGTTILTAFQAALPYLQQFGAALLAGIGGAITAIVPLAQQLFAAFMTNLPALQGLWTQLQAAIAPLEPLLGIIAAVIGGVVVGAIGLFLSAIGGTVSALTGALPGAIQMISGGIQIMGGVFQTASAIITGVIQIVSSALNGDWAGAWRAAQTMVQGVADGISTIIGGLGTMLTGAFQMMIGAITGYVSGFVGTLTGYFDSLLTSLTGSTVSLQTSVQNAWTSLTTTVSATVSSWATAIGNFFSNLGTSVTTSATSLQTAVVNSWQQLVTAVTTSVANLVTTITGKFGDIQTGATNKADEVKTAVENAFNALVTGVTTAMSNLASAVTGGLAGIVGTARSEAAAIGNAIIQGIAGAITAGAGAIASAAMDAAKSALSAAKGILGINSPSKAFAEIGAWSVEGFVQGFAQNTGKITKTVDTRLGGAMPTAGAMLPTRLGLGGGSPVVTVNVYGSVTSERDLEETIVAAVVKAQRFGRV